MLSKSKTESITRKIYTMYYRILREHKGKTYIQTSIVEDCAVQSYSNKQRLEVYNSADLVNRYYKKYWLRAMPINSDNVHFTLSEFGKLKIQHLHELKTFWRKTARYYQDTNSEY